jgi:hypothetical protein
MTHVASMTWDHDESVMAVQRHARRLDPADGSFEWTMIHVLRAVLCSLFAVFWGSVGLDLGWHMGDMSTLVAAGGSGLVLAWLAKRNLGRAIRRR